jgi:dTDP-4-dehydrorhamnose reductase
MKNIILTGGTGQLGTELKKLRQFLTPSRLEMDIVLEDSVNNYLTRNEYSLIVHAAAYTNVRLPETDPQEAFLCYSTNVLGTRNIVKYAKSPIIFISTETVLDPYNFYNLSKLQAEKEIKKSKFGFSILRTSFREDPFEYEIAPEDMLTIGDSVSVIANLINKFCDMPVANEIIYVGTGVKTMYELATKTRKNVIKCKISDLPFELSHMYELLNVFK